LRQPGAAIPATKVQASTTTGQPCALGICCLRIILRWISEIGFEAPVASRYFTKQRSGHFPLSIFPDTTAEEEASGIWQLS
jgi:hypothetical protein